MKKQFQKILSSLAIAVLLVSQVSLPVLAETAPDPGQTRTGTQSDTSDSPSAPTADPSPAPAPDPAPTSTPAPQPTPAPAPAVDPNAPVGNPPSYAFNDASRRWEPTITSSFSWNGSSHLWLSPLYNYDPVVGWYHVKPNVTPSAAINNLTANSADPSGLLDRILGSSNSNTGPGSKNNSSITSTNSLLEELLTNAQINNNNLQTSLTGDATVSGNTTGGDAKTGMASVVNNLLNLLNAMWAFTSGNFSYFAHNVTGDQTGDINLAFTQPNGGGGQIGGLACPQGASNETTGPQSTNNASTTCNNDIKVNNRVNGAITNNVDMLAASGNATVDSNTNAGNAASGDARAQLNIVNLINSAIGAGQSFFGMINIFGNLNGDILFPSLGLNGAVGSSPSGSSAANNNTGPNSNNSADVNNQNNINLNNSANAAFNNNVQANATSGQATVDSNTIAGSATSGAAETNTNTFNLFNTGVFGDNAVLVLINDMGHWVGRIMNLPIFGTSGGGLLTSNATVENSDTGPGSDNSATANNSNDVNVNNSVNGTITNNVNVAAKSGDASVTSNTKAGDATSGNASVASNIANIFGSHLNFKNIFGILIINVFGNWTGSVGIDTDAGNLPGATTTQVSPTSSSSQLATLSKSNHATSVGTGKTDPTPQLKQKNQSKNSATTKVLAAQADTSKAAATAKTTGWLIVLAALAMLLAAGTFSLERKLKLRR